jgi:hypothetical protein
MESWEYEEKLLTSFEVPTNDWNKIGNKLFGWFIAPETTSYRFHVVCDDYCDLHVGLNTSDPLNTTKVIEKRSSTYHRYFMRQSNDYITEWLNFTKGEKYYMYGKHYERWGNDNFVVGVEIEQPEETAIVDHHHAMKEIQYVEAGVADPKFDTIRITVGNPAAGGKYYLNYQNPTNLTYWTSSAIDVAATAAQMKSAVKGYYSGVYSSDINVNLTMYAANGTNVSDAAEAETYVYHIVMRKLISTVSASNIILSKQTQASVTFELPSTVEQSSAPLTGKFRITCPIYGNDVALEPMATVDIKLNEWYRWVMNRIFEKCPGTYDKLELWNAGTFPYVENGISFYIRFVGLNGN